MTVSVPLAVTNGIKKTHLPSTSLDTMIRQPELIITGKLRKTGFLRVDTYKYTSKHSKVFQQSHVVNVKKNLWW